MDWFCWENLNRKPWIFLRNLGLSGFNFPLNQSGLLGGELVGLRNSGLNPEIQR